MTALKDTDLKIMILIKNLYGYVTVETALTPEAGKALFDKALEEVSRPNNWRVRDSGWHRLPDCNGGYMGASAYNDDTIRLISSVVQILK